MAHLTALPPELYIPIIDDLSCLDLLALRCTCQHLYNSISATHKHLLEAENLPGARSRTLKSCGSCLQLLPSSKFSKKMRRPPPPPYMDLIPYDFITAAMACKEPVKETWENRKGTLPEQRFCNDCGARDLPGNYRYQLGERWDTEGGRWWVRCVRCGKVGFALKEKGEKVCLGCFPGDLEERRLGKQTVSTTVEEDDGARKCDAKEVQA